MVKRIGTKQRKTRNKLKQYYRERGKLSLSKYFQEFALGDKVGLSLHAMIQAGRFHPRFHGLTGTITGNKKGFCVEVIIQDQDKQKTLYIHPIHLVRN
ncbi:TPA: 50S ribosomal protein L21e [Candidatus Woesearchaeota archaeon]|nr:50S ribosomal protein L21e [Candidatus Woesearchaeota archaeon]HIG93396.1 50S ribosomal protein L21e [Candidatus Woesearchaeota archaeon]HIH12464.1 50S ribosomal protein L21e [Candidatus Woesearchaeota archaeon]